MRPFERRAANAYPYFKLAVWDAARFTWRTGKHTFPTEEAARQSAPRGARCRVSRIDEYGATELDPFLA